jgi:predicted transcriptional regulator
MPKPHPRNLLEQTRAMLTAWQKIDPSLALRDLSHAGLEAELNQAQQLQERMDALQTEMTAVREQRDALHATIWDHVKRMRSMIKAVYGDDSEQYQMAGGTRMSDRKPGGRKPAAPPAPPAPAQTE